MPGPVLIVINVGGDHPVTVEIPIGSRVLVKSPVKGLEPAAAVLRRVDSQRPNVVLVVYEHSRTSAWVAVSRLLVPHV